MFKMIIISTITILFGILLRGFPPYVSFNFHNIALQISVWIILSILATFILWQIWLCNVAMHYWLKNRTSEKTIKYAKKAMFALMAGKPETAEQLALKINSHSNCGWLGLLIASSAAKEQNLSEQSYKYLIKAEIIANKNPSFLGFNFNDANEAITFGILKSEIYYNEGQYEKSLIQLKQLYKQFPRNKQILLKLATVHKKLNNQEELEKLIPKLAKWNLTL